MGVKRRWPKTSLTFWRKGLLPPWSLCSAPFHYQAWYSFEVHCNSICSKAPGAQPDIDTFSGHRTAAGSTHWKTSLALGRNRMKDAAGGAVAALFPWPMHLRLSFSQETQSSPSKASPSPQAHVRPLLPLYGFPMEHWHDCRLGDPASLLLFGGHR